jgi:hypothetical protein
VRRQTPWWIRPAIAITVLVVGFAAWQIAQVRLAQIHVDPAVTRVLDERGEADIAVALPFSPEQFHSEFFNSCCSIARVEERSFYLVHATKDDVRHIAEQYWVSRVELWNGATDVPSG